MTYDIKAIFDHGVLRPVDPLVLPQGTPVQLRVTSPVVETDAAAAPSRTEPPSLLERLKDVVGSIDDLPADSSTNLDHYLYGRPKR